MRSASLERPEHLLMNRPRLQLQLERRVEVAEVALERRCLRHGVQTRVVSATGRVLPPPLSRGHSGQQRRNDKHGIGARAGSRTQETPRAIYSYAARLGDKRRIIEGESRQLLARVDEGARDLISTRTPTRQYQPSRLQGAVFARARGVQCGRS